MKLQKKVDFVLTVEQSDQQRLMKKWYHLWKTRRIHNDLVLFRFRDVMKGTIQQWLAYSRFRYLKKEEMRRQLVGSHSAFLMSLCKKSIVRFRQNVIAKKRERCFRYVDISSLDELFVRRVFKCLSLQRERRWAAQRRWSNQSNVLSTMSRFKHKIHLRHLGALAKAKRRYGKLMDIISKPFHHTEAKKRILLQWVRLLTRNIVAYQARTTVDNYLLWEKPFRSKGSRFDRLRQQCTPSNYIDGAYPLLHSVVIIA